ncbi:MAG TPA: hypothetical protein VE175_01155, partial [Woeseiaceae bacterium]|nr:hypothetical protein [Woeseiaceae bacterium]
MRSKTAHRWSSLLAIAALVCAPAFAAPRASISAEEILQRADAVRFPQDAFEVSVRIRTTDDGQLRSEGL